MSDQETPLIELRDVHKSFGDNHVFRGLSLKLHRGESLVLIGGSASGKTLIMKTILGLVEPDSGSVLIDGQDTTHMKAKARSRLYERFGMLFQQSALFDSLPVWRNVAFRVLQQEGVTPVQAREVAVEKLASVGLDEDVCDLYPAELSGGMQKRVGFARAIAAAPEIVLLDEPTAGLDPIMSNIINDLILHSVEEIGATTLSINSDPVGAKKIATRIAMLHDGDIIWTGPSSVADDSGNPYVDQFIHKRAEGPIKMAVTQQ